MAKLSCEMNELTNELMALKYPKSHSRKNVMHAGDKSYEAFVLGLVWSWAHKSEPGACIRPNINTDRLPRILAQSLRQFNLIKTTSAPNTSTGRTRAYRISLVLVIMRAVNF